MLSVVNRSNDKLVDFDDAETILLPEKTLTVGIGKQLIAMVEGVPTNVLCAEFSSDDCRLFFSGKWHVLPIRYVKFNGAQNYEDVCEKIRDPSTDISRTYKLVDLNGHEVLDEKKPIIAEPFDIEFYFGSDSDTVINSGPSSPAAQPSLIQKAVSSRDILKSESDLRLFQCLLRKVKAAKIDDRPFVLNSVSHNLLQHDLSIRSLNAVYVAYLEQKMMAPEWQWERTVFIVYKSAENYNVVDGNHRLEALNNLISKQLLPSRAVSVKIYEEGHLLDKLFYGSGMDLEQRRKLSIIDKVDIMRRLLSTELDASVIQKLSLKIAKDLYASLFSSLTAPRSLFRLLFVEQADWSTLVSIVGAFRNNQDLCENRDLITHKNLPDLTSDVFWEAFVKCYYTLNKVNSMDLLKNILTRPVQEVQKDLETCKPCLLQLCGAKGIAVAATFEATRDMYINGADSKNIDEKMLLFLLTNRAVQGQQVGILSIEKMRKNIKRYCQRHYFPKFTRVLRCQTTSAMQVVLLFDASCSAHISADFTGIIFSFCNLSATLGPYIKRWKIYTNVAETIPSINAREPKNKTIYIYAVGEADFTWFWERIVQKKIKVGDIITLPELVKVLTVGDKASELLICTPNDTHGAEVIKLLPGLHHFSKVFCHSTDFAFRYLNKIFGQNLDLSANDTVDVVGSGPRRKRQRKRRKAAESEDEEDFKNIELNL